jgi:hypothetical protein
MGNDDRLGRPVPGLTPAQHPGPEVIEGRHARLYWLCADDHAAALHRANSADDAMWDFLPRGSGFRSLACPIEL